MRDKLTEIVCIIDRSGSMGSIKAEAITGVNCFLEDQAAVPGDAVLTMIRFDNEYEVVHDGIAVAKVPMLDEESYRPRGSTALYDAIGRTIDDVGRRLSRTPESDRPALVIVAILTDGEENASRSYSSQQIHNMIEHQRSVYNWEFIYLGANQDAITEGGAVGIKAQDTANWDSTPEGTLQACQLMSAMVTERRSRHSDDRPRARRRSRAGSRSR